MLIFLFISLSVVLRCTLCAPQIDARGIDRRSELPSMTIPGLQGLPTGTWTTIPCTAPIIVAPVENPEVQWAFADAEDAWEQLKIAYGVYQANTSSAIGPSSSISLPVYAAWAFNWDVPALDCPNAMDIACIPPTCANGMSGAGWLILTSMFDLHRILVGTINAVAAASNNVKAQLPIFGSIFAPIPDEQSEALTIFLNAFSGLLSIGAGMNWAAVFGAAADAASIGAESVSKLNWGTVSAAGYNAASAQIGATLVGSDPNVQTLLQAQDLETMLTGYTEMISGAQQTWLSNVLTGNSSESLDILTTLFTNGSLIAATDTQNFNFNASEITLTAYTKTLYGLLIPTAWKTIPNPPKPFVLRVDRSDYTCGTPILDGCNANTMSSVLYALCQNMDSDLVLETQICDSSGNTWFLLNANDALRSGGGAFLQCPGAGNSILDGYAWGGITIGDMILSSYAGFVANGNKNGYNLSHDAAWFPNNTFIPKTASYPFEGGVATPGFFNFTICLSVMEAIYTIEKGNGEPPCGIIPQTSEVSPPQNLDGYNAGWCGVHIWQSEPDPARDNDENLSSYYQLEFLIKDNVQYQIGYATAQTANYPLIIQSSLPYDLIAAAGSQYNDTLCMWYANQHWCSDSSQCSFGAYSDGVREGDCGFSCPAPSIEAPSSTTLVKPTGAVTALNGNPTTFTRVSTANPATWTPSYTRGWCGIHVREYQRNEVSDHENPYNNYAVEVTVFDAANPPQVIVEPFQQQVLNWGFEILQGPLPYPLQVGVGGSDTDPVYFKYGGQDWNSSPDHVENFSVQGSWDSGHRDINTGFTC